MAAAAFRDAGVEAALQGATLDAAAIEAASAKAADGRELLSDMFADEDYRRHLAKVFVRRALTAAGRLAPLSARGAARRRREPTGGRRPAVTATTRAHRSGEPLHPRYSPRRNGG